MNTGGNLKYRISTDGNKKRNEGCPQELKNKTDSSKQNVSAYNMDSIYYQMALLHNLNTKRSNKNKFGMLTLYIVNIFTLN